MKMVLASNNAGKLAELQTMFGALNVQLVRQSELNISEAEEPYKTFVENALAKARHASDWPKHAMPPRTVVCQLSPTMRACALMHLAGCRVLTRLTTAHSLATKNRMPTM